MSWIDTLFGEGAQGMEIRNPEYMDFVEGLF